MGEADAAAGAGRYARTDAARSRPCLSDVVLSTFPSHRGMERLASPAGVAGNTGCFSGIAGHVPVHTTTVLPRLITTRATRRFAPARGLIVRGNARANQEDGSDSRQGIGD